MSKISLLKPDLKSVYLGNGKGQKVDYLEISREINIEALEKDVKNHATHFAELLKVAKRKTSRVILIDCTNKEQGLMAVSYLAAIYNQRENAENEYDEEYLYDTEKREWDCEDYVVSENELINNEVESDVDCPVSQGIWDWDEHPYKIPVISHRDMLKYNDADGFGYNPFVENNMYVDRGGFMPHTVPYWTGLTTESICIIRDEDDNRGMMLFGRTDRELITGMNRFADNKHVYVINVHEEFEEEETQEGEIDLFQPAINLQMYNKQEIYAFILNYTATLIEIKVDAERIKKYYKVLFDTWAQHFNVTIAKNVPKDMILKNILQIENEDKSQLIEKVYKYILSQEGVTNVLSKNDFEIISRFGVVGLKSEKKKNNTYTKKMENTIIGLEDVKEQIYTIIDVMKYNKKRAKMGYGNSGYHNVHMMIGAPGTAKTTIAELMGNMMMEQNLLPGNRFIAINGAELKGMFVGHSAPKTKAYFDNYDVIFIDEAYSLVCEGENDSFSQEAIAQLIIEIEKHGLDKLVIFAGYGGADVNNRDNKMLRFLKANPGIRSRINSTIYFKSYTPDQMVSIVHCHVKNNKFVLSSECDEMLREYFKTRCSQEDFGNGREARSLVEKISAFAARRIMALDEKKQTKKALNSLLPEDVEKAIEQLGYEHRQQDGKSAMRFGFI